MLIHSTDLLKPSISYGYNPFITPPVARCILLRVCIIFHFFIVPVKKVIQKLVNSNAVKGRMIGMSARW